MVSAQENRAVIRGRIVGPRPVPEGWREVVVAVEEVVAVDGYPNFVGESSGSQLSVLLPEAEAAALIDGMPVELTVQRRSPETVIAERGSLRVEPSSGGEAPPAASSPALSDESLQRDSATPSGPQADGPLLGDPDPSL